MDQYAKRALEEYNSHTTIVQRNNQKGKPFWNVNASQFMFVPAFSFPIIPNAKEYRFTATDSTGNVCTFTANEPTAPLTPIWKDLAVGFVTLKVEAIHNYNNAVYLAGARTFYKTAPFPGRSALPSRACSYKECATKAFHYVFTDPITQHWFTHGTPKPDYYHNVYPSKTISSTVKALIAYAELVPEQAKVALKTATNAADYLISITYDENSKLAGLPPTYSFHGLIEDVIRKTAPAAFNRKDLVMMIYPATVGSMYLQLEKATGDKKYFAAAERIAAYYKTHVQESGSWYLLVSEKTGEPEVPNHCVSFSILSFLNKMYLRTKDPCWHTLERNYYDYLVKTCLDNYNWEGQFEDAKISDSNYRNLTHLEADKMIEYIANNLSDDSEMMAEAEQLMHFVEDQFVVWGDFAPWSTHLNRYGEKSQWFSPAGLEQYTWYVPIDGSTGAITSAFLHLYEAKKDPLLLEKACALGDSVTRMQNPKNGVIPTHWMAKDCAENLDNFWINCHIGTAFAIMHLAKVMGELD